MEFRNRRDVEEIMLEWTGSTGPWTAAELIWVAGRSHDLRAAFEEEAREVARTSQE